MRRALAGLVLTALVAGSASAQTVFDNFGPGDTFNTGTGWTIGTGSNWEQGNAFTPNATGALQYIDAALSWVTPQGLQMDVRLYRVDRQNLPGTLLESWRVTPTGQFGQAFPPLRINSVTHPVLQSGTEYAVIASIDNVPNWGVWNWNNTGDTGPLVRRSGGGAWSVLDTTRGAMRVVIPEPATLSLLSVALLGLLRRR